MTDYKFKYFPESNFFYLAILLVIGVITFFPVLGNNFTNWDDGAQLLNNPLIRKLSVRNLQEIFITTVVSEYHPLVTIIFSIEYHLFGLNPFPYHFHSLLLHLINAAMVYFLFSYLSQKRLISFIGSILFLIHPFQVQVVAWVSARKDLVYTFFYLVSLMTFFRYYDQKKRLLYFVSFLFFIASLLSKTMAVSLPVIILLWIYAYRRPLRRKDWIDLIPYFVISLIMGGMTLSIQTNRLPGSAAHLDFSYENIILFLRNISFYFTRLIFPANLSPVYLFPEKLSFGLASTWFFLVAILVLLAWFRKCREERNNIIWGTGFFLITIFPVLRLLPFSGIEVAANRFIYIPSIGLFYLVGCGVLTIVGKLKESDPGRKAVWLSLVLIIIILSSQTNKRCRIWRNSETLWTEAILRQGESDLLFHMLADSHYWEGRYEESIKLCNLAIALNPAMAYSYLLKSRAEAVLGLVEASAETRRQYDHVLKKLGACPSNDL